MADLISILGEFFWTVNHNFARKDFVENGVFHCASYHIHWPFPMIGFVVEPFQVFLRVDQSDSLNADLDQNWEVQPSFRIHTISILLTFFDKTWSITFLTQVIEAIRDLSLTSDGMVLGIVLISFVSLQ